VSLFLLGLGLILGAGVSAVFARDSTRGSSDLLYDALLIVGCGACAIAAEQVLRSGVAASASVATTMPGGRWIIGIDALSAVFVIAVVGVGLACAVVGVHDRPRGVTRGSAWFTQLTFAVLIASMVLVAAARTIVVFLSAGEIMAITSYLLIVTRHEDADVRR